MRKLALYVLLPVALLIAWFALVWLVDRHDQMERAERRTSRLFVGPEAPCGETMTCYMSLSYVRSVRPCFLPENSKLSQQMLHTCFIIGDTKALK